MQDKCPKCGEPLITKTIKKELGYGSIDYPIALVCPKCHWSKDLTGAGDIVSKPLAPEPKKEAIKQPAPPKAAPSKAVPGVQPKPQPSANLNKIITIILAILVLGGIVWAFFPYPSQKPAGVTTPTSTPNANATQTIVQPTGIPFVEVTPTGKIIPVFLDSQRGFIRNKDITIQPGDKIVWTNTGTDTITLVSSEGIFEDQLLANYNQYSYIFNITGTYNFYLKENSSLRGTVIVS